MAKKQRSELAAGLFVVVALAVGVGVLLWLGAADVLARPKQTAVFFFKGDEGNLGLATGNFVQINDARIGKITRIRYEPRRGGTLYYAKIESEDVKIRSDAKAHPGFAMVGAKPLVVTSVGTEAKSLADEDNPVTIGRGGFDEVLDHLAEAAQRLNRQLDENDKAALLAKILRIADTLAEQFDPKASGSLMAKIHGSADDLNAVSGAFRKETDANDEASLLGKAHASADSVKSFTGDAAGMAKKIRPDVETTLGKVREYTEKDLAFILAKLRTANTDLVTTVGNLKVISGEGRQLIVLNRKQLQDTIVNLKVMSDNLSAAAKEIRRNPWRLLHRPSPKATASENIYDAARAFGEGAGQLTDAIARLKAVQDAKGVLHKDDPLLLKIRQHLQTSYEKFTKAEKGLWDALKQ